jgi:hypothetical protein
MFKMQKARLKALNSPETKVYESMHDMLFKTGGKFIGFENGPGERYILCTIGPTAGIAISARHGAWATEEEQSRKYRDGYFIFDTVKELYQWLLEAEH